MHYSSLDINELTLRDADRKIEFCSKQRQAELRAQFSTIAILIGRGVAAGTNTGYSGKPKALKSYLKDIEDMFKEKKIENIDEDEFEEIGSLLSGNDK